MKNARLPLVLVLAALLLGGLAWFFTARGSADGSGAGERAANLAPKVTRIASGSVASVKQTSAAGRVLDAASGAELGGAVVQFVALDEAEEDAEIEPVVSAPDGSWTLENVASGRYRVTATAAGHLPGTLHQVSLVAEQANVGLDLQLVPGGNRVFGNVSDATGGGIEGAVVRARPVVGVAGLRGETRFAALTDADGNYALHLADGRIRVAASHPDYAPEARTVKLSGGDRKVDMALTPMGIVEGVVLTRSNRSPVVGAFVRYGVERDMSLPGGSSHQATRSLGRVKTDAHGRFRISGLVAGTITLAAVTEGWATREMTRVPLGVAEQREGVELLVDTAFSIRGRVVVAGTADRGISSAEVAVVSGSMADVTGGGETDDEGNFAIHGLATGTHRLAAFARGYVPTLAGATVEVDGDVGGVVIELEPGLAIIGRVEPPQVAEVSLDFDAGNMSLGSGMMMIGGGATTTSAPDGTFELRPVQVGQWSVTARTDDGRGGTAEVDVTEEGAPEVVIDLGTRASVAGVVRDSAGTPVEGATVQLTNAGSGSSMVTVTINGSQLGSSTAPTDDAGEFVAAGLAAGEYDVRVVGPLGDTLAWSDGSTTALVLTLADSEQRQGFELAVEQLDGSITGVVREAGGGPVPDVWVRAVGSLELPEAKDDDYAPKSKAVFAMVISDGDDGETMGAGAESRPVLTDAHGRFAIERLRATEYTVIAEGTGSSARTKLDGVRPGSEIVLELAASGGIKASVTFEGAPVGGGVATLAGPVTRTKRFDGDGFEIDRLEPGHYRLSVVADMGGSIVDVVVAPGETSDVDVAIEKWVHVSGRVVNKSGEPVVDARIEISAERPDAEEGEAEVSIEAGGSTDGVRTDDEGRFETTVGSGSRMLIVLGGDMPMPLAFRPFVVQGEDVDLGDIEADQKAGFSFSLGGGDPGG